MEHWWRERAIEGDVLLICPASTGVHSWLLRNEINASKPDSVGLLATSSQLRWWVMFQRGRHQSQEPFDAFPPHRTVPQSYSEIKVILITLMGLVAQRRLCQKLPILSGP